MTIEKGNPANATEKKRPPRIPMSTARRRLEVPERPGWHRHWFKEDNVPAAIAAYYEHVKRGAVELNQQGMGSAIATDGNTDLGTNVSLIADKTESGTPVRAYLMEIPEELFTADQHQLESRNSQIMQAIFGDEAMTATQEGKVEELGAHAYRQKALFQRPTRKAKIGRQTR
jgi:hypothetical protein